MVPLRHTFLFLLRFLFFFFFSSSKCLSSPCSRPFALDSRSSLTLASSYPNRSVFHEYPHPENWREIVDELYDRFGPDGGGRQHT